MQKDAFFSIADEKICFLRFFPSRIEETVFFSVCPSRLSPFHVSERCICLPATEVDRCRREERMKMKNITSRAHHLFHRPMVRSSFLLRHCFSSRTRGSKREQLTNIVLRRNHIETSMDYSRRFLFFLSSDIRPLRTRSTTFPFAHHFISPLAAISRRKRLQQ